jgi:GMP synthase (glutamine-hydrolysing)
LQDSVNKHNQVVPPEAANIPIGAAMSSKRLLILQNERADHAGYLGQLLQERSLAYDVCRVGEEALPAPASYAAVIALGGSQHLYEREKHPYFTAEEALIRQIVQQQIPFLGICLGGQLLASAFASPVKRHSEIEIGFFDIPLTAEGRADPLYEGFPGYHTTFHWHEDTFALPAGSVLLASNSITPNQAFRYGQCAYGIQYHIELTPEMLHDWMHHDDAQEDTLDPGLVDAIMQDSLRQFDRYHAHSRLMLANFLSIGHLI